MTIKSEKKGNVSFISVTGDLLGEGNGLDLLEAVNDNIIAGVHKAIIDLSAVRYMNSNGIGVLITALTKLRNKGGELVLLNPTEQVKKLMVITKLNSVFTIAESETQALEHLSK